MSLFHLFSIMSYVLTGKSVQKYAKKIGYSNQEKCDNDTPDLQYFHPNTHNHLNRPIKMIIQNIPR